MILPQSKKMLCTLGPSSLRPNIISRLSQLGASLFRINLSHTALDEVEPCIQLIQNETDVPICLDSEGAQVRTGRFTENAVFLKANSLVSVHGLPISGTPQSFNFYPENVVGNLQPGDLITIDFNSVLAQVVEAYGASARLHILNGGTIGSNKAVTIERELPLEALTEKDRQAFRIGKKMGIEHYALSFANKGEDVEEMRRTVGEEAFIISKIESLQGVTNLEEIAELSNALLIDRGDLSRQVAIEFVPSVQKSIIRRGKETGKPVYVATNLLESMVIQATPTRAEVNDIHNTLLDGADGLVLAAETAIGKYPIQCAGMIVRMMRSVSKQEDRSPNSTSYSPISLLSEPHGGTLINLFDADAVSADDAADIPAVTVSDPLLMDCEQIALGTFSPLEGFMSEAALNQVLDHNSLGSGLPWTMPIVLQFASRDDVPVTQGPLLLKTTAGAIHSMIDVQEIYEPDLDSIAKRWFGTTSDDHPGVQAFRSKGPVFVGGPVTLLNRLAADGAHFQLTPAQLRSLFHHRGWSQIVAFHTRNPVHRGHEHIQKQAMDQLHADGLFINPVVGQKKVGDFLPEPIFASYKAAIDAGHYQEDRVVISGFATHSRFAGPREAVFTALCRKNMGCSHFIIGRDHTGVGTYYHRDANRKIFDSIGDLGIEPFFSSEVYFDPDYEAHFTEPRNNRVLPISGTEIRDRLRSREPVPNWQMRQEVQNAILEISNNGRPIFFE